MLSRPQGRRHERPIIKYGVPRIPPEFRSNSKGRLMKAPYLMNLSVTCVAIILAMSSCDRPLNQTTVQGPTPEVVLAGVEIAHPRSYSGGIHVWVDRDLDILSIPFSRVVSDDALVRAFRRELEWKTSNEICISLELAGESPHLTMRDATSVVSRILDAARRAKTGNKAIRIRFLTSDVPLAGSQRQRE